MMKLDPSFSIPHMPCILYRRLATQWMILIDLPNSDHAAVAAYWEAIEHRAKCQVCRDEIFAQGCSDIYSVIAPSAP